MHQRRRSRRGWEWMSPAPAEEASFQIRNQQDASRDAFERTCKVGFSADETSFVPKSGQGSSKKSSGTPMNEPPTHEDVSKRRELKYRSPNLISRLMGLDTLPSPSRKEKNKDVFEVTKKKHKKYGDSKGMHNCRGNKAEIDSDKHMFLDDASQVLHSRSDVLLELLQDPKSLSVNHLPDQNCGLSSPNRSKGTALSPTKGSKIEKSDGHCRSSRSEGNPDRHFRMRHGVTGSDLKMHAESLNKSHARGNSGFVSKSLPAHIVILKPSSLGKAKKVADAKSSSHENFRFCSRRYREIVASVMEELCDDGTKKPKMMQRTNIWSHKVVGSIVTGREIRGKLRKSASRFTSEMNPNDGIKDSFTLRGIPKSNHSEAIYQAPDYFSKWSNCFSSPFLYSSESSVSREARNRLFERWKIDCQFQDMRLAPLCSRTLREILELSDRVTPEDTVDFLNTMSASKTPRVEVHGIKGNPLSISCKSGFRDGRSGSFPRLKSQVATSCHLELSGRKQGVSCREETQVLRPSFSTEAQFSKSGTAPLKSSKHHPINKPRRSRLVGEENTLPEWETCVNSEEGSSRSIRLGCCLDNMSLDYLPNYASHNRNQLVNDTTFPVIDDNSWHLTTQEEQDIWSDHPQEELLPSESDVAESHPQISKETEQPSPVSVLESPCDDETYSSGCFERLSVDLKELRLQLHLLKLESVDKCTEEDVLTLSDADSEGESNVLLDPREAQQFRDEDRDFTYLLDMLIESGIRDVDENKILDSVNPDVFYKLEKKYRKMTTWSRSERKLLFDLINYIIGEIASPYMNLQASVTSKIHRPMWDREGLLETLWQMLVKKRKEQSSNEENKILEPAWFDVDLIGIDIERMLNADLLEELVGELVLSLEICAKAVCKM